MKVKESPLVSIIVASYQSEEFIMPLLESIRLQTWDNIELIITDDGSTDKTVQICSKWIEENKSRFVNSKILTVEKNTGIPANCDRGLSVAKGKWIKFIGADDVLLQNCIKENMNTISHHPNISFIISDLIEIDRYGNILRVSPKNEGLIYFMKNQGSKKEQLKAYARWPAFLNTPTFFYKRELIEGNINSDYNVRIFEDTSAIFNIINKGAKIFYLKKPTVKYRIHNNATSRNASLDNKREKELYEIFKKYRVQHLSVFNIIDLSVFYENWLRFKFKGINGHKGIALFRKFSAFYWHLKFKGIKV